MGDTCVEPEAMMIKSKNAFLALFAVLGFLQSGFASARETDLCVLRVAVPSLFSSPDFFVDDYWLILEWVLNIWKVLDAEDEDDY